MLSLSETGVASKLVSGACLQTETVLLTLLSTVIQLARSRALEKDGPIGDSTRVWSQTRASRGTEPGELGFA